MTTPACSSRLRPTPPSKPRTSWRPSTKPLIYTDCPHHCCPTTAPSSPPHHARARCSCKQSSSDSASDPRTRVPTTPKPGGKIERLHQTLKRSLPRRPPSKTIAELQSHLNTFVHYYNNIRPHRALDGRTPLQAYNTPIKARPATGALPTTHFRVRQDKVDKTGSVTLRHNSKLHHIGIGRAHKNRPIKLLIADQNIRIIDQQTGQLTLNPNHDYQPINQP